MFPKWGSRSADLAKKVTICYHKAVPPHYPPADVKSLAGQPAARRLTRSAIDGCLSLGMPPEVIWETLAALDEPDCRFIKTLDSDQRPGEKLDVYDALVGGQPVYVKIKIVKTNAEPPRLLVVLSFKRNEYYD